MALRRLNGSKMGNSGKCLALFFFLLFLSTPVDSEAGMGVGEGMALLHQGRYREALAALAAARRVAPLDPDLKRAAATCHWFIGIDQMQQGDLGAASLSLQSGQELAPEDERFSLALGSVALRLGKTGEAEHQLLEALRRSGPSPEVYTLLARVCYDTGRLGEAESYLLQALDLAPDEAQTQRFLTRVRQELRIETEMDSRHSGLFSISFVEGGESLGGETLEVLREAYAELGALFNAYPGQEVAVILYGRRDFAAVTGAPDWSGGVFDGKIRMPVGGLREMSGALRRALYHEYAHLLIRTVTRGRLPHWLNEGLAQVAEGGEGPASHLAHLEVAGGPVRLLPFTRLSGSLMALSASEASVAYAQSHDFVRHLLDQYGWARMLDLLEALGGGEPFEAAVNRLLLFPGESLETVMARWVDSNG